VGWWPWKRETRSTLSISDPALAQWLNIGSPNYSGVDVGESSALALSALWRAVSLISGTIASLPLRTLRDTGDGMRQRVTSFLDNPGGEDGPTPFCFWETAFSHAILHGDCFLVHRFGGAGQIVGLVPLHPQCVSVRWVRKDEQPRPGGKVYTARLVDGTDMEFDASTLTQISGLSLDGLRGFSLISLARNSLGTGIAGERAAARVFSNGMLLSGLVTPEGDDDLDEDDLKAVKADLDLKTSGWEHSGGVALVNRALRFTPWTMTAEQGQFMESRKFSVEEVSRWTGVPPHALMQTEKQTSWGTGVAEQNRGLSRTVLSPWAKRFEEKLSRLLPSPRFVEWDFAGLERGSPETEIDLLIRQVEAGLLTVNEARAIRNLPPLPPAAVEPVAAPATEEVAA
jgi:HK97 family phage portal protein